MSKFNTVNFYSKTSEKNKNSESLEDKKLSPKELQEIEDEI